MVNKIECWKKVFEDYPTLDGMLLTSKANKFYLGSLYSGRGYVLLLRHNPQPIYFVDYRSINELQGKQDQADMIELKKDQSPVKILADFIEKDQNCSKIGIEASNLTVAEFAEFKKALPQKNWLSVDFERYRWKKSEEEIVRVRQSCVIANEAYLEVLNFIKIGMTEAEVANQLTYQMKKRGAEKEAFDTIVASGIRGALPHGKASIKKIKYGDFVTIDFGARSQGYCSDMTRTFVMGEILQEEMLNIYQSVKNAQQKVMQQLKPDVVCSEMDDLARQLITQDGYGEYFTHHLGHGIGIECHETPRLAAESPVILKKNMLMTNEPGIYIPNLGGVRIEDTVLITETGCEQLTTASKELIII